MAFEIKTNDTSPAIEYYLQDEDGNNVDISSASVKFLMREYKEDSVLIDASASIVEASEGHVKYQWGTSDTSKQGKYQAEWEVTYSDGEVETFPNTDYITIKINEDIG